MGFFSRGLSLLLGRTKTVPRQETQQNTQDDGETTPPESEPATPNSWIAYHDAFGRPCWRNNLTGQWTYDLQNAHLQRFPHHLVQQPAQVWPAPPLPGIHQAQAPWNGMVPVQPVPMFPVVSIGAKEKKKTAGVEERGYWETVYDSDGDKSWRHTKTNKVVRKDPYD